MNLILFIMSIVLFALPFVGSKVKPKLFVRLESFTKFLLT